MLRCTSSGSASTSTPSASNTSPTGTPCLGPRPFSPCMTTGRPAAQAGGRALLAEDHPHRVPRLRARQVAGRLRPLADLANVVAHTLERGVIGGSVLRVAAHINLRST